MQRCGLGVALGAVPRTREAAAPMAGPGPWARLLTAAFICGACRARARPRLCCCRDHTGHHARAPPRRYAQQARHSAPTRRVPSFSAGPLASLRAALQRAPRRCVLATVARVPTQQGGARAPPTQPRMVCNGTVATRGRPVRAPSVQRSNPIAGRALISAACAAARCSRARGVCVRRIWCRCSSSTRAAPMKTRTSARRKRTSGCCSHCSSE